MATADLYCRISRDDAERGLGVARQEHDLRAYAERHGWDVAEVHVDNDVSASRYSRKPRPGYHQLLARVRAGQATRVVVWDIDRIWRKPTELEELIDLAETTSVEIHNLNGDLNLRTADGRFIARMLVAKAAKESDDTSRRITRKHLELAQAGKLQGGGTRPFGYEPDRTTIRPSEATLVREAAGRVLAGETVHGICVDWTARGVATVTGGRWRSHVLKSLLVSPRIAGLREHHGAVAAVAEWAPIVDRATHERLRAVLTDPARRTNHVARRYLLTGLAHCSLCGRKLVARPRGDKRRAYVCASGANFDGCGKIGALADTLEAEVVGRVLRWLDSDEARARVVELQADVGHDHVLSQLGDVEAQLEHLAAEWGAGSLSQPEWQAARGPLLCRLETLRSTLVASTRDSALDGLVGRGAELAAEWSTKTLDQQRAVLHPVVDHVVVAPAVRGRTTFDPTRVSFVWRG